MEEPGPFRHRFPGHRQVEVHPEASAAAGYRMAFHRIVDVHQVMGPEITGVHILGPAKVFFLGGGQQHFQFRMGKGPVFQKGQSQRHPDAVIGPQGGPPSGGQDIPLQFQMEGERILSKIKDDDYVIALCIDGKHYSTSAWKKRMERVFSTVSSDVVFVIGGSLGLADKVVRRANEKLSFSALTFPHQMMRLILCEQIARIV